MPKQAVAMRPGVLRRHDLIPQYARYREEIDGAIARVLASGQYVLGLEGAAFEAEFARYVGRRHGVGVASGTDAIALALRCAGIGRGDEVLTATYAPTPTAAAILMAGATPVFVDVEPSTASIDPRSVEEHLSRRSRCVLVVHLFGLPCDMVALQRLARLHDLVVIEDAAQAHGSRIGERMAGSLGHLACFSFYPTKNLGGYGDGGMVLTDRDDLAAELRLLRNYGKKDGDPLASSKPGVNSRLDELQAAVLRAKLPHLDTFNEERRVRARRYREGLAETPLRFFVEPPGRETNHHILTVLCAGRRDELRDFLEARGIQTNVYYPEPLHAMEAYRRYAQGRHLPVADELSRQSLALPLYPELPSASVEEVIDRIREFFRATKRPQRLHRRGDSGPTEVTER